MKSFESWLIENGLGSYTALFLKNKVCFDVVRSLSEADLRELGIALGDRKRILQAISKLEGQSTTAVSAVPVGSSPIVPSTPFPAPETAAGERRQLTVMFCDLVGSTALSEKLDPEELRSLLHNYRTVCGEVIARYEGHVARYVGDGILTYFGWPKAHEEDAERALRAALEIIKEVKRASIAETLAVRIGIATGFVVIGEQAGVGAESKLAVGSTPNVAARLQGIADSDQIIIASSTRRLVGHTFELVDLGEHEVKGISEPIHAWRVIAVSAAASRFEAATHGIVTPLVGREKEIGLLLDRWQLAQEGDGQVVLLSGEPGIGKSRILSVLCERLEAQDTEALRFQCSPYHVNSALYSSIDYFERVLQFRRDDTAESKLDKLEALMVHRVGGALSDVRFVASILSIPFEQRYGAIPMAPRKQKQETLRTVVDFIEATARMKPSVMLYEDLHWADPTSLEVVDLLIDRVRSIPLLIVLTYRPEFQPKWSSHGHITALNLAKLTRSQSGAIVSKITSGKSLPAELLEQIQSKTDGVPLYIEELTRSLLESKELHDLGDRYDYAGAVRSVTIPATLRDSLMARLDRSLPAKEIAQIGAAIGREFSYELIAAVAPLGKDALDAAINQLTVSGLVFRRGTPPEASYTFKHALVQDAAYDSLLKSRRQELHAKIVRVIDERFSTIKDTRPEVLAHHLTAAGQSEAAIGYWQEAGMRAINRFAVKEAISHLNKGLELVGTLPSSQERDEKELDLQISLGTAWMTLKGWAAPEVWTSLHPALGLAKAISRRVALMPIYHGLWNNVMTQGRLTESLEWTNEMLATAEATGDADLLLVGHRGACVSHFYRGDFNQSCTHGESVMGQYNEEQHRLIVETTIVDPKTSAGSNLCAATWILGYPDSAAQLSNAKDVHARRRGHPFDLGYALTVGSQVWDFACDPVQLLARVEEAERLGRAHSLPFISEVLSQIMKGIALIRAGRLAEGIPQLRDALERWITHGALLWMPYLRAVLAEGLALGGEIDGALKLLEDSLAQIERPGWGERAHLAEVLRLKGWMLQLQGKLEAAEENYRAALDVARQQEAKSWELRTSTSLARLLQNSGKPEQAYELLAPIYDWFTEGFDTKDLKDAKAQLDKLKK